MGWLPHFHITRRAWRVGRLAPLVAVSGLLCTFVPAVAHADTPRGLSISPIRQYVTVEAGGAKTASFSVGNQTSAPIDVSFSVKQFSVADYSYDFSFNEVVGTKLLDLSTSQVKLDPSTSRSITYRLDVPRGSTPGGRYYTILASARLQNANGTVTEQVQAASLVYITITGNLKRTNNIGAVTIPRFNFGASIPFTIDVSNTGNTHYFMYLDAHLAGPGSGRSRTSGTHLLLPIKTRHLESSLPSPVLPGIYKASIGYRTEFSPPVSRSAYIVYIPPWSVAATVLLGYITWFAIRRHRNNTLKVAVEKSAADHTKD